MLYTSPNMKNLYIHLLARSIPNFPSFLIDFSFLSAKRNTSLDEKVKSRF